MKARQALIAALLVGCAAPALAAQTQGNSRDADIRERQAQLRRMDTDNDGVITRAEWRGSQQSFRMLDTNNDGVLSGDEIWTNRGRGRDRNAMFDRADRDNDGMITSDEVR